MIYHVTESTTSTTSLVHVNQFLENCAKICIACSQTTFYAHKNSLWEDRPQGFQTSVYVVIIFVHVALSFYLYCISLLVSLGLCTGILSNLFTISLSMSCHAMPTVSVYAVVACVREFIMPILYLYCTLLL